MYTASSSCFFRNFSKMKGEKDCALAVYIKENQIDVVESGCFNGRSQL